MRLMNEAPPSTGQESWFYHLLEVTNCTIGVSALIFPSVTHEIAQNDT